jgi:flagellar basal-body rod protein FlgG
VSDAFHVGAVGLQTQQQALEALANNIANVNTPGFKRSEVRYADVVVRRAEADAAALASDPQAVAGVMLDSQLMLNEQGELERTGRSMDLAIQGAGFLELMGPAGQTLLWRGGALKINDDGLLATDKGLALRAAISVPHDATAIEIGADGVVRAAVPDAPEPVELGQIQLVRVNDPASVTRLDGGLYRTGDDAQLVEAQPGEDGAGLLVQGAIERSNVALTDEMVRLMMVQRAYGANAQILQAADQLMGIANGLRR